MIHAILARYRNGYHRLCAHRSRHGFRCYRGQTYDGMCPRHQEGGQ